MFVSSPKDRIKKMDTKRVVYEGVFALPRRGWREG